MHVFACLTPDCGGSTRYTAGWIRELALEGCVWTCWECGTKQIARVPLDNSRYLGFITEETSPV